MSFTSFLNDRQTPGAAQPQTANQLFGSATFQTQPTPSPSTGSSEFAPDTPAGITTASDLFNASAYDPAKLHPLAGLGDNLDYLLLDEAKLQELPGGQSALPSRGWSDELSYGTGTTYLSGESIHRQIDSTFTRSTKDISLLPSTLPLSRSEQIMILSPPCDKRLRSRYRRSLRSTRGHAS
jgi:hypothetical protein